MGFARAEWRVERICWVVIAVLLYGAVLGVFGTGPLSRTSARQGGLKVDYDRFGRYTAPTEWRLHLDDETLGAEVRIGIDDSLLSGVQVTQVTPQPLRADTTAGRLVFTFGAGAKRKPMKVTVHLKHQRMGPISGDIGLVDGPVVTLSQFVYP